jgi:hypothetical protein
MTTSNSLRAFRILPMGAGKAQTNDNIPGPDFEDEHVPYSQA